jgi:hypothetical protein
MAQVRNNIPSKLHKEVETARESFISSPKNDLLKTIILPNIHNLN